MPSPYLNTGTFDQRDAITKALMNVNSPPPQTPMPQMPQAPPPQMNAAQAPAMGTPVGGAMPPQQMPISGGVTPSPMGAPMGAPQGMPAGPQGMPQQQPGMPRPGY